MADDRKITVRSFADMAIRIGPVVDADGNLPEGPEQPPVDIAGSRHPDAIAGTGITRGVDARMFHAWLEVNPHMKTVLVEIGDEVIAKMTHAQTMFGFEPGLQQAADDALSEQMAVAPPEAPAAPAEAEPPTTVITP